jgi:PadR family transcriptional regulator, regulatory protein AphA
MNYKRMENNQKSYVECLPDGCLLKSESQALDLIAACSEYETNRLLIHKQSLPDDFFNLRSGLAGAVLQKFVNYNLRVALVIGAEQAKEGRFGDMVIEANRGSQLRFFNEPSQAEAWLINF